MNVEGDGRRVGHSRLARIALLSGALMCALLAAGAPRAGAGGYSVVECYPAVHVTSAADVSWSGANGSYYFAVGDCSNSGVGLGAEAYGNTVYYGDAVVMRLGPAPQGAHISSGTVSTYHTMDRDCSVGFCQSFDNWWGNAAVLGDNGSEIRQLRTSGPSQGFDSWSSAQFDSANAGRQLQVYETCSVQFCAGLDLLSLKDVTLFLTDSAAPTIDQVAGSLVNNAVAFGVSGLHVAASDQGSGIASTTVEVNGTGVASPQVSCPGNGPSYHEAMRPCEDIDSMLQYDTERPPWRDGANTMRICVTDVADDSPNTACEQRAIRVDNTCPDSSGADGEATSLTAGLQDPKSGTVQRTRAVRSTDGVPLHGSVTDLGTPVRGASLCVYETVDEPAGISQLVQVAKSSSNGEFGVNLPPGPSRTFQVAYRYGDRGKWTDRMYLDSSVVPTLKVTRKMLKNGRSVGFRGHVPGPHADGVAVVLQARAGRKWRTFKQVTTDQGGAYRGKYRFTQTHGRARYLFRALVKKQGGYPYSQGASRKRQVLVHG